MCGRWLITNCELSAEMQRDLGTEKWGGGPKGRQPLWVAETSNYQVIAPMESESDDTQEFNLVPAPKD